MSEAAAMVLRHFGLRDYDGRVKITTALAAISQKLSRRNWGEIADPQQLVDYLERGANRVRYDVGRAKPAGRITHLRAIQENSGNNEGKEVLDELMLRCDFILARSQASLTKDGVIPGGIRGRCTHAYVSVFMPGTPVKSFRPVPRGTNIDSFVKELYEIKWKRGLVIIQIDVKMAEREFGVDWMRPQSFAGMTRMKIPPQRIIDIIDWDTGLSTDTKPRKWKNFQTSKAPTQNASSAYAPPLRGSVKNEEEKEEANNTKKASTTKVLRFEKDDTTKSTPNSTKSPFFKAVVAAREEGYTYVAGDRSGGQIPRTAYPMGREALGRPTMSRAERKFSNPLEGRPHHVHGYKKINRERSVPLDRNEWEDQRSWKRK